MRRLAIFPLSVVLLPGAALPLHIFEPRYRRMVERCLETDRRFGLVFHDPDRMGPFMPDEPRVGTVALIENFEPLPDGRSLVVTRGEQRVRLRDGIESDEPFYEAVVEPYEDADVAADGVLRSRRRRTLALFHEAVRVLARPVERVPEFEVDGELSFRLAATLEIDPAWLQSFLEIRDERQRLERLDAIFQAAARSSDV